jgi:hypothetical protein
MKWTIRVELTPDGNPPITYEIGTITPPIRGGQLLRCVICSQSWGLACRTAQRPAYSKSAASAT